MSSSEVTKEGCLSKLSNVIDSYQNIIIIKSEVCHQLLELIQV